MTEGTLTAVVDRVGEDWVVEQITEFAGQEHSVCLYRGFDKIKALKIAEYAQDPNLGFEGEIPQFFQYHKWENTEND